MKFLRSRTAFRHDKTRNFAGRTNKVWTMMKQIYQITQEKQAW